MTARFNQAIDTLSLVGDRLSLAHVFTGIGPDMGLTQILKCSRWKKAGMKQRPVDKTVESVSPSVIGIRSAAVAQLRETEDDRWLQVEGGSSLHWRSCKGCAFLCAPEDPRCEACGLPAPGQCSEECVSDSSSTASTSDQVIGRKALDISSDTSDDTDDEQQDPLSLREVAVVDDDAPAPEVVGAEVPMQHLNKIVVVPMSSPSEQENEAANDAASESSDDELADDHGDELQLEGTLDLAPAPGTYVKALYDDDEWHLAQVLSASGSKARLCFEVDGSQATLDLATHAVRLADYESEDEGNNVGSEGESDAEDEDNDLQTVSEEDTDEEAEVSDGECEQDMDEEEEEYLEGLMEAAPAVGSLVKVFFEDDRWHTARVKTSNGTKAVVVFEDDEEDEVDFEVDSVRSFDYVDQEEQHKESHEKYLELDMVSEDAGHLTRSHLLTRMMDRRTPSRR